MAILVIPAIIHEDDHLLVVNKPAGMNTHAPSPFAGEGIYDWLRHREPRWADLAIVHRLDKDTSGLMVFCKTVQACRSLTEQFSMRRIKKSYELLTDRPMAKSTITVRSHLARVGDRYASTRSVSPEGWAITHFETIERVGKHWRIKAIPESGKTHQIRVHAAESGFPILGDCLYGGTPAERVFLHAKELAFEHPSTGQLMKFNSPSSFIDEAWLTMRRALLEPDLTNCNRWLHGASDGVDGLYVDQLDRWLLVQGEASPGAAMQERLKEFMRQTGTVGCYVKVLNRKVRVANATETSPQLVLGEAAPEELVVRENGVRFGLRFGEGYSVGLFLDQRDNRRRFLTRHVASNFPLYTSGTKRPEVLNTFAYTCAFSVCAALGGARTTSLDLSSKYLEWGRHNFTLNGCPVEEHEFIKGDVFDWFRRFARKGRQFDVIILDPPTFSSSKASGVFRVEKDYGRLVQAAAGLLRGQGVLLASANTARWPAESFVKTVGTAIQAGQRRIMQKHYVPQPPDFPISREEPAFLKTFWLKLN